MRDNLQQEPQKDSPSLIRERALDILATIGSDRKVIYNYELYSAILMAMDCVDDLFSAADKMRRGRDYLLTKIRDQEKYILTHAHEATSSDFILLEQGLANRRLLSPQTEKIFCGELMAYNSPP
ncbi:unnamed protein product [Lasius platythorax]|uniref:Uncharacterized protein n=1 Tax=Lasius platythorax TaxID=488582 RepID=A0AAV2MY37_9HYME